MVNGAGAPRRPTRTSRPWATAATGAFDRIEVDIDAAELLVRRRFEHVEQQTGEAAPASPLYRLRAHRPYWLATMQQIGLVSALVLSIITDGCGLDWDPAKAPPTPPVLHPNLPTARAEAAYVSEAVSAGIMQPCARSDLICVLPLGVALNRAGKRRLIWDGRHVNSYPRGRFPYGNAPAGGKRPIRRRRYGGTFDVSAEYHHVHMRPDALPYLGF